jgi:hypothetical protein
MALIILLGCKFYVHAAGVRYRGVYSGSPLILNQYDEGPTFSFVKLMNLDDDTDIKDNDYDRWHGTGHHRFNARHHGDGVIMRRKWRASYLSAEPDYVISEEHVDIE